MRTRLMRTALSAVVAVGAAIAASVGMATAASAFPADVPPPGEPSGPACGDLGELDALADLPAGDALGAHAAFSTMAGSLAAAGLVDTLNGDGPFTVFAPTNDAFDTIPANVLESILADDAMLSAIVGFHVIEGEALDAAGLAEGDGTATLGGNALPVSVDGDTITLNGMASVTCAGIPVANGVIHVIGGVLQPPTDSMGGAGTSGPDGTGPDTSGPGTSGPDVTMVATPADGPTGPDCANLPGDGAGSIEAIAVQPAGEALGDIPLTTRFFAALEAAGLTESLNGEGPFTILAPTDEAFAVLGDDLDTLMADAEYLAEIISYHVIAGEDLSAADLVTQGATTSAHGAELDFTAAADGSLTVNTGESAGTCSNLTVANGTVHLVGALLIPPA